MKKIIVPLALLAAGAGVGGAAAWGTALVGAARAPFDAGADAGYDVEALAFVPAGTIVAPLVSADGRLAGYVAADVALGVPEADAGHVAERLPLLLHAVNLRSFQTPLAAGPDGLLPDIERLRALVADAAAEAYGKGVVREVAVVKAVPA